MTKFLNPLKQHRYYVPTRCTHIEAHVDPATVWPVPECGAPVWGASSFCEHHHRRMYRPGKPLKLDAFVQSVEEPDHEADTETERDQLEELA